jgi:thymidylate synthase (FAD)
MRLIDKPRVVLMSRPVIEINGVKAFLREHSRDWPEFLERMDTHADLGDQDGEWIAEACARLCYMSYGRGRSHEEHIQHILEVAHGSTIEHANFGLLIWNVSRSLTHELVRTRAGAAYSQLSQRYVDESETDMVIPPAMEQLARSRPDLWQEWQDHMRNSVTLYSRLVEGLMSMYCELEDRTERRKKSRQAARSVLPNATETKIAVTFNARAMRWWIEQRAHPAADVEIRRLAVEVFKVVQPVSPLLFFDMKIVDLPDGTQGVEAMYHKV